MTRTTARGRLLRRAQVVVSVVAVVGMSALLGCGSDAKPSVPPTFEQLEERAFDGQVSLLEVALTEFAFLFEVQLPGALEVTVDDSAPDEPTWAYGHLMQHEDELTAEQRRMIDEAVAEVDAASRVVHSDVPGIARDKRSHLDDATLMGMVADAKAFVVGQLGGTTPRLRVTRVAPEARTDEQREKGWLGWASQHGTSAFEYCHLRIVDLSDRSLLEIKATVVHEFYHCWDFANSSLPFRTRPPGWVVEGLATWVAAEAPNVDPANSIGHAKKFFRREVASLFGHKYRAIGFFWQLNQLDGGPDALWGRIPGIIGEAEHAAAFRAATSGLAPEALAMLAAMAVHRPRYGPEWEMRESRLGDTVRERGTVDIPVVGSIYASRGKQRAVGVTIGSGASDAAVVQLHHVGMTILRWAGADASETITDGRHTNYCHNPPCECEDGSPPLPDLVPLPGNLPALAIALTGGPTEAASLKVSVTGVDEACSEVGEPDDQALVAEWVADPDAIADAYNAVFEPIGVEITGVSGELRLTMLPDSSMRLEYDQLRLYTDDGIVDEFVFEGQGEMLWRVEGGRLVFYKLVDLMLMQTTPSVSPVPLVITAADLPTEGTTSMNYSISGSSLNLSDIRGTLEEGTGAGPTGIVFPSAWRRVPGS